MAVLIHPRYHSPRVILVEDHGVLAGLLTIKDVLRYTLSEHGDPQTRWDQHQFNIMLEEGWTWVSNSAQEIWTTIRRIIRR